MATKTKKVAATPTQEALADVYVRELKKPKGEKKMSKQAMMEEVGMSPSTASSKSRRTFTSQGFLEALAERGITQSKMTKVFDEAMAANVVTVFKGQATETDAPDHKTRLASLSLMGDFLGMKKTTIQQLNVNVNMDDEDARTMLGLT
jgi:hypothetical protein